MHFSTHHERAPAALGAAHWPLGGGRGGAKSAPRRGDSEKEGEKGRRGSLSPAFFALGFEAMCVLPQQSDTSCVAKFFLLPLPPFLYFDVAFAHLLSLSDDSKVIIIAAGKRISSETPK